MHVKISPPLRRNPGRGSAGRHREAQAGEASLLTLAVAGLSLVFLLAAAGCDKKESHASGSAARGAGATAVATGGSAAEGAGGAGETGGAGGTRGAGAAGGNRGRGGPRGAAAFPVEVTPVEGRSVEYIVSAVGSVEAFEVVHVTARVAGAVERVAFREGDAARAGDVLVEIEPERYQFVREEADAALEKARAALAEAEAGFNRRESVNQKTPGLIPGEEVDAWRTRVRTAAAEVAAREADLKLAERNERDARASAPVPGILQTRDVQTGQYVQPGDMLATLVRREPLLLRFEVPEGEAARIAPGMTARFRVRESDQEHSARITHVAESADRRSRMVPATAEVTSPDRSRLRPGAFAEVFVPVGVSRDAAVVPQTAVRPSERGFLAFVIREGKAEERVLTLGLRTSDGLVEVRSGLAPAESLVVRGAEALEDGARVRVVRGTAS